MLVPSRADETADDHRRVLADLGQQSITVAEVDFQLGRAFQPGNAASEALPRLSTVTQQSAVHLIALQRQALQTLRTLDQAASRDEVDAWLRSQASESGQDGRSVQQFVDDICRRWELDEFVYRDTVAFRLSWQRYLAKHLTQENLARHFANQPARFDGTRFQVDRVSIAVPAGESGLRAKAAERLNEAYRQSLKDEEHWRQLLGDSKSGVWEIDAGGWVRGSGDLDPTLIGALLNLEEGQISPPVHTATGVHILKLLATEPGQLGLEDVAGEVRHHMLVFLLEHLASPSQTLLPLKSRS